MKLLRSSTALHRWSAACLLVRSVVCECLWTHGLYSPPGPAVNGLFQARTMEWVTISYSRGFSQPRGQTCISCIGRWGLYHWATWEILGGKPPRSSPTWPWELLSRAMTVILHLVLRRQQQSWLTKGQLQINFRFTNFDNMHSYVKKSCDSSLRLVLFIETPVRVFYMFDLGINTRTFYSNDHCSDPEDHSHLVWNLGEI